MDVHTETGNGNGAPALQALSAEAQAADNDIRAATSIILQRMQFLRTAGLSFRGARDLYEVLGYDRLLTTRQYRDRYARGGLAGRVVDVFPNATWRSKISVVEDEDPKTDTEFEKGYKSIDTRLKLQQKFLRVDKLAGLSTYAVLLIGSKDGNLQTELPKGRGNTDDIMFVSPFSGGGGPGGDNNTRAAAIDADCTIQDFEVDLTNPRWGLPRSYQLRRVDVSSPVMQRPVHWSRIIHVAENLLFDDVYGQPSLERVWNLLDDLDKVTGGGAEAFWLRANQGLHLNIDKDMNLPDAERAVAALKEQSEEYKNQITRWLRTRGVEATTLGSDVADFNAPADAVITQIAGSKAIPKRILVGSEAGELASSQDRDNWKDQVRGRQDNHAGPNIVRAFLDRLIEYNYLTQPKKGPQEYLVVFEQIETLTETEKARGAKVWAETTTSEGPVFTPEEIRDKWYGMEPLKPEEKLRLKPVPPPMLNADGEPQNAPRFGQPREPEPAQRAAEIVQLVRDLEDAVQKKDVPTLVKLLGLEYEKLASTQIQLTGAAADALLELGRSIPDEDLCPTENEPRETDAHITVKYGLKIDDPAQVRQVVEGWGPVEYLLGNTSFFESEEYDVLFVEVESEGLHDLNAVISQQLDVVDTHPLYTPHATVAYLKKGLGVKYAGRTALTGLRGQATSITFSSSDHIRTRIEL